MKKITIFNLVILTLAFWQGNAQTDPHMLTQVVKKDNTNTVFQEQNYAYDSNGKQIQKIQYSYVGGNTYGSKTVWIYDNSTGYINEIDFYNYDSSTNTWTMTFKTEYLQYDSNGNILEEQSSYYDNTASAWVFSQKATYYYNAGVLDYLERFYYDITTSTWQNQSKEIYTYTTGLLTLKLNQQWDSVNNSYFDTGKWYYTYDSNNLLTEKRFEYFDTNTSTWVNSQKTVNIYDPVTLYKTVKEEYYWDVSNNLWIGNSKEVYNYDSNGNMSTMEAFQFDSVNNTWNSYPSNVGTGTYDNSVDRNNLGLPEDYSGFFNILFNHKIDLLHLTQYNSSTSSQEPFQDWEFYYTPLSVLGVNTSELTEVTIYPNPVSTTLNIEGSEKLTDYKIFIYDMQGKQVLYRTGQNQINVQTLKPGNYIYRIIAKEGIKNGVMIKN